jgi:hypothetical protein
MSNINAAKFSKFLSLLQAGDVVSDEYIGEKLKSAEIELNTLKTTYNISDYKSMTNTQLKEILKSKKLKLSGKKDDLIRRIMGENEVDKPVDIFNTKDMKKIEKTRNVLNKGAQKVVHKNSNGNYVDDETMFVFDPVTRNVIGKEIGGVIVALSADDIEECTNFKYKYNIPENLDEVFDDIVEDPTVDVNIGEDDVSCEEDPYAAYEDEEEEF